MKLLILIELVAFYVEQHNSVMPCRAFNGRTPDEVYFGTGGEIEDELAARRRQARAERVATNRALSVRPAKPEVRQRRPYHAMQREFCGAQLRGRRRGRSGAGAAQSTPMILNGFTPEAYTRVPKGGSERWKRGLVATASRGSPELATGVCRSAPRCHHPPGAP